MHAKHFLNGDKLSANNVKLQPHARFGPLTYFKDVSDLQSDNTLVIVLLHCSLNDMKYDMYQKFNTEC